MRGCGGLFAGPTAAMLEKVTGEKVFARANGNGMEKVVAASKMSLAVSPRAPAKGDSSTAPRRNGRPRAMGAAVPFGFSRVEAVTGFEPV